MAHLQCVGENDGMHEDGEVKDELRKEVDWCCVGTQMGQG